jgi:hypothetical protein
MLGSVTQLVRVTRLLGRLRQPMLLMIVLAAASNTMNSFEPLQPYIEDPPLETVSVPTNIPDPTCPSGQRKVIQKYIGDELVSTTKGACAGR